jgi:hypothetical protein
MAITPHPLMPLTRGNRNGTVSFKKLNCQDHVKLKRVTDKLPRPPNQGCGTSPASGANVGGSTPGYPNTGGTQRSRTSLARTQTGSGFASSRLLRQPAPPAAGSRQPAEAQPAGAPPTGLTPGHPTSTKGRTRDNLPYCAEPRDGATALRHHQPRSPRQQEWLVVTAHAWAVDHCCHDPRARRRRARYRSHYSHA